MSHIAQILNHTVKKVIDFSVFIPAGDGKIGNLFYSEGGLTWALLSVHIMCMHRGSGLRSDSNDRILG